MAELDYAFIAEFAKVELSGTLTAIGASYLEVRPLVFPAQHPFSIAGRIRAPEDTAAINLVIRINPPGNMNVVSQGRRRHAFARFERGMVSPGNRGSEQWLVVDLCWASSQSRSRTPVQTGAAFVATNNGVQYSVSSAALIMTQSSTVMSNEPMSEYWSA
jgi:hypothetical protein